MSQSPTAEPSFGWAGIDRLVPNNWNPNAMSSEMFDKAVESIHRFGFVDPITVRDITGTNGTLDPLYQIIDGEHRLRAALDHSGQCVGDEHVGMTEVPITNLGIVSDHVAKQLTIVLNETRGEAEPRKLGLVLVDLIAAEPLPTLLPLLPFSQSKIEELAEIPSIDWDDPTPKVRNTTERWVERVYRIPSDAVGTFDKAMESAKSDTGGSDWQALVALAERYLDRYSDDS